MPLIGAVSELRYDPFFMEFERVRFGPKEPKMLVPITQYDPLGGFPVNGQRVPSRTVGMAVNQASAVVFCQRLGNLVRCDIHNIFGFVTSGL